MPRSHRALPALALAVAVSGLLAACGDRSGKVLDPPVFPPPATTTVVPSLPVTAPVTLPVEPLALVAPWVDGSVVPDRHTCAGDGVSPPLSWTNVPAGTVELALAVTDVDDGDVAWLVYGVAPSATGILEGQADAIGLTALNSSGEPGWDPPCPADGETADYRFTLYALNQQLEAADEEPAADLLPVLDAITIARSSVTGVVTG